ncbi:MAG: transporter substrate-binding domain-containing protein [Kiloniellales bacterium]|nr:transporter substrate-binding domain-containing protein [Kiloniellales bacterium]
MLNHFCFLLWAGVVANILLSSPGFAGEVLDRILARGYITMNGVPDWPPFSSKNENGDYVGFDVDVANEVAHRMGVEVRRLENIVTWGEETGGNWNGKIDISIGSMTPTAKRGENLDFPAIYTYAIASLAVHKDNTSIRTPADASGKRIGALQAATYELYLRRVPFEIEGMPPFAYQIDDPIVVTYPETESDVFKALAKGDGVELDALVNYLPTLMSIIQEGMPFRIIGQPLYRAPQAVAIEPGDPELAARLKQIIDEMRADGTLTKLSMKWFDFDMTKP